MLVIFAIIFLFGLSCYKEEVMDKEATEKETCEVVELYTDPITLNIIHEQFNGEINVNYIKGEVIRS